MTNFGISMFGERADHLVHMVRIAEELGFARVQIGDHVVGPVDVTSRRPYRPNLGRSSAVGPQSLLFDTFSMLGALAAGTNDIGLQSGVIIAPLRHPLSLAQAAATIQSLAGGRFDLGLGAGWMAEEFVALDVPFAERGSRLEESIGIIRSALVGGPFSHDGTHFRFDPLVVSVPAVEVPILMGGTVEPALRRVARLADGWFNPPVTVDECLRLRDVIESYRVEEGTADRPFRYFIQLQDADDLEIDRYQTEGFTNLTLSAHKLWKHGLEVDLSAKEEMLRAAAERFGVQRASAGQVQG